VTKGAAYSGRTGSKALRGTFRESAVVTLMAVTSLGLVSCKPAGEAKPRYETAAVKREDLSQVVTASGSLSAVVSVDVGSQISGIVNSLYADFNSPVKKNCIVAEIEPSIYQAAAHQAEGDLASAKAGLELCRQTLVRKESLIAQHAATQADYDKAIADLHQAEATVTIKTAALERARADLDHCKIYAPVDGIVIARKVDVGQTVAAAMTTPILFTIAADITKMHIDASVSEADIGQVNVGQKVDFNVDAFPDEVFHGVVAQVRKAPTTTNNVVTYSTIVDVDNPEQKLFPGMTADISIHVAERKNVPAIPNAALRFAPPEGAKFTPGTNAVAPLTRSQRLVYVVAADRITLTPILTRVGVNNGVDAEVLEGLKEGDRVVTGAAAIAKGGLFGGPGK
jgi:HlyD family secretion protein